MKRLRDESASNPTRVRGTRLLRSGSPSPRRPLPEMKRRVWARLVEARTSAASARTTRHPSVRRRSAVLTLLLVLSTATAGAVIGRRVIGRGRTSSVSNDRPAVVVRSAGHQRSHKQPEVVDDFSRPLENGPSAEIAVPIASHHRVGTHSPHGTDRLALERSVARAVADEKEQAAHKLLVDAMFTLRRTRDFERAGVLLEDYLTKYPHAALREEAIALAVEAAAARADLARRDYWASVYVKDYPAGRFRAFIEASRADRK